MKLTIFYSWQTETNTKYNKNFILSCIEKSVNKLKRKPEFQGIEIIIEEGVRGEPGSVDVAATISKKRIPNCDIFIADLSVVNQVGTITKLSQRIFDRKKFRPSQNNNVINEYGIATNAIGQECIIGILNNVYGSPNENPNNIPFDIRHVRFPIEYNYSAKTKEKKDPENELISGLTSALKSTFLKALQNQKNKYTPFVVWSEWEKLQLITQAFIPNPKAVEINETINKILLNPKYTLRILGLSGLGKTRTLLEFFRPTSGDTKSLILSSSVLYLNCNEYPNFDFHSIFSRLLNANTKHIVVLDNCSVSTHRLALNYASRDLNKISFISIGSDPEEFDSNKIDNVNYLLVRKDDFTFVVDQILERDFKGIDEDNKRKIKEFSQGIPLMGVLLAQSLKNGEKYLGKLEDKLLLDKLLGNKGQDIKNRNILKACSLFNYFGYKDNLAFEVEFIAKNKHLTNIDGDDVVLVNNFIGVCNYYLNRGIFEQRGRLIGIRPFPLAMYLAQEWLEPCTPERFSKVIETIVNLPEPHRTNLSEAFAEQMKYLRFNNKAVEIVDIIIGYQGPFDNAEVINTELGSRFFRSFVEVNPIAVSNNFKRNFSQKTTEELLLIKEGRRNIVWVLEKLCFDKRTFKDSAKILYSFAVAENESWSNNATGQFLHLFNVHLSGTEAKLSERWEIIQWGLNKNDEVYFKLALQAMNVGLNYRFFSRLGGAEKQGTKSLTDNIPSMSEIKEYWSSILDTLVNIIESDVTNSNLAANIIADHLRTFFYLVEGEFILPYIKRIILIKNNDWDQGLASLKKVKKFEINNLLPDLISEIDELIIILTKNDFINRFLNLSSEYYFKYDGENISNKVKDSIIELANEFITSKLSWKDTLPLLYKNQQFHSFEFGKQVYRLLEKNKIEIDKFFNLSISILLDIPKHERNYNIIAGFIVVSDAKLKEFFYNNLFNSNELRCILFNIISIDESGKNYFYLLFELVKEDKCKISEFYAFTYSAALTKLNLNELIDFSNILFEYNDEGYEIVFDLFYDLGEIRDDIKTDLNLILKKCIYKLGANKNFKRQLDDYKWANAITRIISDKNEVEIAKFINNSIIESINIDRLYHLDSNVQYIYQALLQVHFHSIWPDLSNALLSIEKEYFKFYGLKYILGSSIGGIGRRIGILFDGDLEEIFNWCIKNKPLAPARIAELSPIFDKNNSDFSNWHPISLKLLDLFGDIDEVLISLSSNMGTYSWVGSIVPYLEAKKLLFTEIINHPIEKVRIWASSNIVNIDHEIIVEKNRDEETFI